MTVNAYRFFLLVISLRLTRLRSRAMPCGEKTPAVTKVCWHFGFILSSTVSFLACHVVPLCLSVLFYLNIVFSFVFLVLLQVLPSKQQQRHRHVVRLPNFLLLLLAPRLILLISTGVLSLIVCPSVLCCLVGIGWTFCWQTSFHCLMLFISLFRSLIFNKSLMLWFTHLSSGAVLWFSHLNSVVSCCDYYYSTQWSQRAAPIARWRGGSDQAHDGQDEN